MIVVCPTTQSDPFVSSQSGEEAQKNASVRDIDNVVGETAKPSDLLVVELVGLTAAAVSAATATRRIKGSSERYGIPLALAWLKLPTGAITAFLGLLLMRGQFAPGRSVLDSSASTSRARPCWKRCAGPTRHNPCRRPPSLGARPERPSARSCRLGGAGSALAPCIA